MSAPLYDIFSGHPNENPLWVEAVDSLAAANHRMAEHAREKPGPYFIFCHARNAVLASVDTSMSDAAHAQPLIRVNVDRPTRVYSILLMKKDSEWSVYQVKVKGDVYRDFFVEITAADSARGDVVERIEWLCDSNFNKLPQDGGLVCLNLAWADQDDLRATG